MGSLTKRNRRTLLRHRKRGHNVYDRGPMLYFRLPLGTVVSVYRYPLVRMDRGAYRVRSAEVFGPYPPDSAMLRELQRWA